MKETWDILDNPKVASVKCIKPKNLTFTVHKSMSVLNALKMAGK